MGECILISKASSLEHLERKGKELESILKEEFSDYNPRICWKLLDGELSMEVILREKGGYDLFGMVDFSSDVSDEKEREYSLSFFRTIPAEPFRYSQESLEEWASLENAVADFVLNSI